MFYRLRGTLIHTEPGAAVIECGGVGFRCLTTMNTLRALPPLGEEVILYTHLNVREDALDLFGFATEAERACFRTLTAVSGVGAKVGLSILSSIAPEQLAVSIGCGDYRALTRALLAQQRTLETQLNSRYQDMLDYYTLWAHQIKTPIAAMRLRLQSEDSDFARRLLSDLGRIEQYVEMVLTYLRLEGEGTDYVFCEARLDDIVRPALRRFAGEFIARRLTLDYTPTDVRVLTDEKWLSFVIEQVLSNALKYTPQGGVSVYVEEPKTLCIRDTGIGIAPEDLPRVFERGYTGLQGRADKRASGIGLYLCRRICRNLGHTITAESRPGEGTTVRIKLEEKKITVE